VSMRRVGLHRVNSADRANSFGHRKGVYAAACTAVYRGVPWRETPS
jgi:hypothetical protein